MEFLHFKRGARNNGLRRLFESSLRHQYPFQAIPRTTNDVEIREPIFERRILTVAGQME
jgi:hypothetical protein